MSQETRTEPKPGSQVPDKKHYQGKRRSKGSKRKPNGGVPSVAPETSCKESFGKPGNDFAWWSKLGTLTRDSATFKANYVPGKPIAANEINYVVPGVLSIVLDSHYMAGNSATDPINVWARDTYLKMFQKYRPVSGYSASDLGIVLLATLEAVKLIAFYERLYGILNRYSRLNVNIPFAELSAYGLSAATVTYLQGHMSDFRYDLNYLITKAQRLCIPKDIALVADAISLFGYEYIDHDNPRGQIILFMLRNYGVFNETALTTGSAIEFNDSLSADLIDISADNMCKALDTVLTALLGSDSVQRIFADLVVWFGEAAMLTIGEVPEDYVIIPAYSESILHKIHNLETLQRTPSYNRPTHKSMALSSMPAADIAAITPKYWVYQYNDAIVTDAGYADFGGTNGSLVINGATYTVQASSQSIRCIQGKRIIDGYTQDVPPDFVVEGSLLKSVAQMKAVGSDLFTVILSNVAYVVIDMQLIKSNGSSTVCMTTYISSNDAAKYAGYLALLDWAPLCYYVDASSLTIQEVYGDLDIVLPISISDLTKIHRTCILSGLNSDVPVIKA